MENTRLSNIQISAKVSVKEALKQMDRSALKILFVTDDGDMLKGSVTDGDFRRGILAGYNLDGDIEGVFNHSPVKFQEGYDIEEVKRILVEKRLEAVPIIDSGEKIIDVLFWEDVFGKRYQKNTRKLEVPVVIMAGGMGTRFSTVTKILPKPLIPFGDKPVIEVIMDNFRDFGCSGFYLLLGYKGAMIQSYFDNTDNGYNPEYVFEPEPLGTIGALSMLDKNLLPESFFVSNCDIVIKSDYVDIYDFHRTGGYDITIVSAMRHFVIPYGVMDMTNGGSMKNLTEKPEYDFLVNTGMYVMKKDVLKLLPEGKVDVPDLIKRVQDKNGKVGMYPISEKSWVDIGQPGLWEENDSRIAKPVAERG